MAQRSSSGRGATATGTQPGNQTPNTPRIRESDIAKMRVNEIREELRKRGVSGISRQRKDELVKTLAKAMRAEARKRAAPAAKKAPAKKAAAKKAPAAKKTATKKTARAATRKSAPAASEQGPAGGRTRQGSQTSRTLKYSQRISSPEERPSRPGRSLVTTDHRVIRQWAEARNAKPATVRGTEHDGRPGVLRFDFPGFQDDGRLRQISWDEWFETFDTRGLNFIYQETRTNGGQSNFFRLESPTREDA